MNFSRLRSSTNILFVSVLLLATGACSTEPPTSPDPTAPLVGTWILMKTEGLDVSSWQYSYTVTRTQMVLTAVEGCRATANYTVNGVKLISTGVSDECFNTPAGSRDTATWSVSGDRMTLVYGSDTTELRKGTANPVYSSGTWRVETIDGDTLQAGDSQTLVVSRTAMQITRAGSSSCTESFSVARQLPGFMTLTRIADGCDKPIGETLMSSYEITGATMTLMIGNVTYVATRM